MVDKPVGFRLVLATLSAAWPFLLVAGLGLTLIAVANFAVYRAVRPRERLVQVLAAMAMTVLTVIALACVLVVGAVGVLVAFCPADAFECPA